MRSAHVFENESLNELAVRLRVPACMLMRVNGIYSPAWLLPGREILVPDAGACLREAANPCPVEAFAMKATNRQIKRKAN